MEEEGELLGGDAAGGGVDGERWGGAAGEAGGVAEV